MNTFDVAFDGAAALPGALLLYGVERWIRPRSFPFPAYWLAFIVSITLTKVVLRQIWAAQGWQAVPSGGFGDDWTDAGALTVALLVWALVQRAASPRKLPQFAGLALFAVAYTVMLLVIHGAAAMTR